MVGVILLYVGAVVITVWGIAHIVATKPIVSGFGSISKDNRRIITMESIAEGLTLCFIGLLVLIVLSLGGPRNQTHGVMYLACAGMLIAMAILTGVTGARTSILPYKICPGVKTVVAILFLLGAVL